MSHTITQCHGASVIYYKNRHWFNGGHGDSDLLSFQHEVFCVQNVCIFCVHFRLVVCIQLSSCTAFIIEYPTSFPKTSKTGIKSKPLSIL
jgi:hypothetical protein